MLRKKCNNTFWVCDIFTCSTDNFCYRKCVGGSAAYYDFDGHPVYHHSHSEGDKTLGGSDLNIGFVH